jgi:hypothetical protein
MRWATRALIHLDRVASAWLILRFVDPDAQFIFLTDGQAADDDVTLFGLPGTPLAAHDGEGTTFQRIVDAYSINDPALALVGNVVTEVVSHVMHDRDRGASRGQYAAGVLAVAEGTMLLSATDAECLKRSLPVYDALYVRLQAQIAMDCVVPSPPASVLEQTLQLSRATSVLRKDQANFSSDAFAEALRK